MTEMKNLDNVKNGEMVETANKRLQNFLYILGIDAVRFYKKWDGQTIWVYRMSDEFRSAVSSFGDMVTRRNRLCSR